MRLLRPFKRVWRWLRGTGFELRLGPPPPVYTRLSPSELARMARLTKFRREVERQSVYSVLWIMIYEEGGENSFPEMRDAIWRHEAWNLACTVLGPEWHLQFAPPDHLDGWVFLARRGSAE